MFEAKDEFVITSMTVNKDHRFLQSYDTLIKLVVLSSLNYKLRYIILCYSIFVTCILRLLRFIEMRFGIVLM